MEASAGQVWRWDYLITGPRVFGIVTLTSSTQESDRNPGDARSGCEHILFFDILLVQEMPALIVGAKRPLFFHILWRALALRSRNICICIATLGSSTQQ